MSEDAVSSSKSREASRASHFMFAGRPKVRKTEIMQCRVIVECSLGCVQITSLCAAVCLFCGLVWLSPELAVAVSLEQQQRWVSTATPLDTCGARFRDLLTL